MKTEELAGKISKQIKRKSWWMQKILQYTGGNIVPPLIMKKIWRRFPYISYNCDTGFNSI